MLVCPKCGKNSNDVGFIEAFCVTCYPVRLAVPPEIIVNRCRDCQRVELRGEWQRLRPERIREYVLRQCRGDYAHASYDAQTGEARFTVEKRGNDVTVSRTIPLQWNEQLCPDCNRKRGGYYEAVLQFRGNPKKAMRYAGWAQRALEKSSFVGKVDETKDGIDVYVGSFPAAMRFVQTMGWTYQLTRKLVGRREGKRVYRATFALRFD